MNTPPKPQKKMLTFRGRARPNVLDIKQEATVEETR